MGSPLKSAVTTNRANRTVARASAEVSLFNGTKGCSINSSDVSFLGSGDRGHAFSTYMECPNGHKELVAFKVAKTWDANLPHYISSSNIDKKRLLYDRLLAGNTTDPNLKKYVSVQFGTVTFQREMLYEAMNKANEKKIRKVVNVTDQAEAKSSLVADIFTASSSSVILGKLLRGKNKAHSLRRQIAKDLVYIYRTLCEKSVMHPDVRLNHILYSEKDKQTMLIDFEEFRFLDNFSVVDQIASQQDQLWQLFALIGNVCEGSDTSFEVPWGAVPITRNKTNVMQRLVPALEMCQFERRMVWITNSTGTDVAQTYKDLATWVGLS